MTLPALILGQGHRKLYSLKNSVYHKNRLHSRQQPCRLRGELRASRSLQVLRQTVIGIGLRKLFYQNSLLAIGLSGSAAVPLPRVPLFLFNYTLLFRAHISGILAPILVFTVYTKESISAIRAL